MVAALRLALNDDAKHIEDAALPSVEGLSWQILATTQIHVVPPFLIEFLQRDAPSPVDGLHHPDVLLYE